MIVLAAFGKPFPVYGGVSNPPVEGVDWRAVEKRFLPGNSFPLSKGFTRKIVLAAQRQATAGLPWRSS